MTRTALPADVLVWNTGDHFAHTYAAVPMLAALIVVQTLGDGRRLVLDARGPALAVAALLAWRRAPFLVVVLASAATAALLRAIA